MVGFCNDVVQNKMSILPKDYYVLIIYLLFITLHIYYIKTFLCITLCIYV